MNVRRWTLAGVLVVTLALAIGLNVAGLREELLWKITPPPIHSIAVLPLENLSRDPEQAFFAQCITTALSMDLQRIGTFRVIAFTSAAKYKNSPKTLPEIGRELDVDAVVRGGVTRSGDRIRITANLTHAATNRRFWEQIYERDLRDTFILQGEISLSIAREIHAQLTPRQEARLTVRRPMDFQAYEAYLGSYLNPGSAKAEENLKRAIHLEPQFALSYDNLAQVYAMRMMYPALLAPKEIYPKAKETAQKGLSIDPDMSASHQVLAKVALEYEWNFIESEKEFKRALEITPYGSVARHRYAHFLLSMGRAEEARAETRRAIEIDRNSVSLLACASWHEIAARKYDEAEKLSLQALRMGAPDQLARVTLGWSYLLRRRFDEAIPEFQKAVVGWNNAVFPTAALGHAYAVAGQEAAARQVLDKLLARSKTEYVSPYEIAVVYAGLGDRDRAFEWLDKAFEDRSTLLVYFRMDPRISTLRTDPRFQDLLRRMNFPQAAQF